jgi:gliding motility-associated-like protein
MKPVYIYLFFVLAFSIKTSAQDEDPPSSPVLTFITVIPETGKSHLNWNLSPSPDVAGYIIYNYRNGEGYAFDTLWNPAANNYLTGTSFAAFLSESYVVAAIDSSGNPSPLSNVLGTIFSTAVLDTCNNSLRVGWNLYPSLPKEVTGYRILKSINNGTFEEAGIADPSQTSFTLGSFETGQKYCIVVSAILEGGFESKSNKSCIMTEMERPPDWINADYATVADGKIAVSFTADPLSELVTYRLEKRKGDEVQFNVIETFISADGVVEYTDAEADPGEINTYRLGAVNNCGTVVTYSNIAGNMVTKVNRDGNKITLTWNSYSWWLGGVSDYRININYGNGYSELVSLSPADTIYMLNYSDLMYETGSEEICFVAEANENVNIHGIAGKSTSAPACIEVTEIVTLPNAFTPNGDLVNDLFSPVFSFTPVEYSIVITDLKNNRLFESVSHSQAWDGTSGGVPKPQGVYLYYLRVTAPSGKVIIKNGTVTILDN